MSVKNTGKSRRKKATEIPVVCFVGRSNSGKTTLLEKVIPVLIRMGFRVGAIKHDAHSFEMDHRGKDTWRMAAAGADKVAISSAEKTAVIWKNRSEPKLGGLVSGVMEGVDVVLTEGYKTENKPKIEVIRKEVSEEMVCGRRNLLAVVTDSAKDFGVRTFGFEQVLTIAEFIEKEVIKNKNGGRHA